MSCSTDDCAHPHRGKLLNAGIKAVLSHERIGFNEDVCYSAMFAVSSRLFIVVHALSWQLHAACIGAIIYSTYTFVVYMF